MTKQKSEASIDAFDLNDIDSADEAEMEIVASGRPTGWMWKFAGPGHPQSVALFNRLNRERLLVERQQEQARVNGKKWQATAETVDEVRAKNAEIVVARLLDWSAITMGGEAYPFSAENARKLLLDPRKGTLLVQALDFLADEAAFTKRSATS